MAQMAVLRTKYIPWRQLDTFNQIAGAQIPRHETNVTRPGLLARNYLGNTGEDGAGVIQAYQTPGRRGFYVGLAYPQGMEETHPEIKKLASRIRRATRETVGRHIRTQLVDFPIEPAVSGYTFAALELTSPSGPSKTGDSEVI